MAYADTISALGAALGDAPLPSPAQPDAPRPLTIRGGGYAATLGALQGALGGDAPPQVVQPSSTAPQGPYGALRAVTPNADAQAPAGPATAVQPPAPASERPPIAASDLPGDVLQSAASGIEKGALGLLSLPRTIHDAADAAVTYGLSKVTGRPMADIQAHQAAVDAGARRDLGPIADVTAPSYDALKTADEAAFGPLYEPKSVAGDYAQTAGEFLPGAGRHVIAGALVPAVASEAAGQATKGTGLEPYARAAGALAGGVVGAAGAGGIEAAKVGKGMLDDYRLPATPEGPAIIAGRRLQGAMSDPAKATAALGQDATIVPGSAPTAFQATGDLGLGQLERQLRTTNPEPFIQRDVDQNAARVAQLQAVQPTGAPTDVAARFRQMRDDIDQRGQAAVDAATPTAQAAGDAMGGFGNADSAGAALRGPLADARAAAKEEENRLHGLVNPELGVPTQAVAKQAQDVQASISSSATPMSGEEARIFSVASGYPDALRFGDVKDLRSSITDATAAARLAGNTQSVRRLGMLRQSVDYALDHGVETQAGMDQVAVARGAMDPDATIGAQLQRDADKFIADRRAGRTGASTRAGDDGSVAASGVSTPPGAEVSSGGGPDGLARDPSLPQEAPPAPAEAPGGVAPLTPPAPSRPADAQSPFDQHVSPDVAQNLGTGVERGATQEAADGNTYLLNGVDRDPATGQHTTRWVNLGPQEALGDTIEGLRSQANVDDSTPLGIASKAMMGIYRRMGIGDTPTYAVAPEDFEKLTFAGRLANGFYSGDSRSIYLQRDGTALDQLKTAVHEGAHAAFDSVVRSDPEVAANVAALQSHANAPAFAAMRRQFGDGGKDVSYGTGFRSEFLTEAFSNPHMQEYLSRIPAPPALVQRLGLDAPPGTLRTAWDAFKATLAKAFGFAPTPEAMSMLDATLGYGDRLSEAAGRLRADAARRFNGDGQSFSMRGTARAQPQPAAAPLQSATLQDVSAYRAANAATKARAETFDEGVIGDVLAPGARGGYDLNTAAVPGKLVPSGKPTDADMVRRFVAAGGSPDALSEATAQAIRNKAGLGDGTLDPGKVFNYLRQNRDALAEMPPEVAAKFRDAATAQQTVNDAVAARKAEVDAFNKTALAKVAGLDNGTDVVNTVGAMLGRTDGVQQIGALARAAQGDEAATAGLRRALVEHMFGRTLTAGTAGGAGEQSLKPAITMQYLGRNAPALRQVFSEKELGGMMAVARDVDRAQQIVALSRGNRGSSNTAQDLAAGAEDGQSIITKAIVEAAPAVAGKVLGGTPGAILGWLGAKTIGRGRAAGLKTADDLVLAGALDPALAKALVAKVPVKPDSGTADALGAQFARIARGVTLGVAAGPAKSKKR